MILLLLDSSDDKVIFDKRVEIRADGTVALKVEALVAEINRQA
jgi:hypothetical protein